MNLKRLGQILIIVGLITISAIIINHHIYWLFVDILIILTCIGSGIYLLRKK